MIIDCSEEMFVHCIIETLLDGVYLTETETKLQRQFDTFFLFSSFNKQLLPTHNSIPTFSGLILSRLSVYATSGG